MTHRQQTQKLHDLHKALRVLRTHYEDKTLSWDTYNECVKAVNVDIEDLKEMG